MQLYHYRQSSWKYLSFRKTRMKINEITPQQVIVFKYWQVTTNSLNRTHVRPSFNRYGQEVYCKLIETLILYINQKTFTDISENCKRTGCNILNNAYKLYPCSTTHCQFDVSKRYKTWFIICTILHLLDFTYTIIVVRLIINYKSGIFVKRFKCKI